MRIENNNNLAFGAYFKNNEAFKKVFAKTFYSQIDKPLFDEFVHKQPAHEIEIINKQKYSETMYYTLFDNSTGISCGVGVNNLDSNKTFNKLLEAGIKLCRYSALNNNLEEIYKIVTNQNDR